MEAEEVRRERSGSNTGEAGQGVHEGEWVTRASHSLPLSARCSSSAPAKRSVISCGCSLVSASHPTSQPPLRVFSGFSLLMLCLSVWCASLPCAGDTDIRQCRSSPRNPANKGNGDDGRTRARESKNKSSTRGDVSEGMGLEWGCRMRAML